MPEVSAVSVSPTWAVPLMVGAPVARLLAAARVTVTVYVCSFVLSSEVTSTVITLVPTASDTSPPVTSLPSNFMS